MPIEWRKEMLLQQLDLSGLEGWSGANHASAHALPTGFHDVFSLEPGDLGCINLAKHEFRVVDDEPFKEILKDSTSFGRGSEGPHEWKCWKWVLFTLAKAHGVTLLC